MLTRGIRFILLFATCLAFIGLSSCGGGMLSSGVDLATGEGGSPAAPAAPTAPTTPTTPAAVTNTVYGGVIATGDAFRFELNQTAGEISFIKFATGETAGFNYLKDPVYDYYAVEISKNPHVYMPGWLQQDGFGAFLDQDKNGGDLIMCMALDTSFTDWPSVYGKTYGYIIFKHSDTGLELGYANVASNGIATGYHTSSVDEDPVASAEQLDFSTFSAAEGNRFVSEGRDGTITVFARDGVLLASLGATVGSGIFIEQSDSMPLVPAEIQVGDIYRIYNYKRTGEAVENHETSESRMQVTAVSANEMTVEILSSPDGTGTARLIKADKLPGFLRVEGGRTAIKFINADVLVSAENSDVWHHSYGIGFRE